MIFTALVCFEDGDNLPQGLKKKVKVIFFLVLRNFAGKC
jgi:hypothetical protein